MSAPSWRAWLSPLVAGTVLYTRVSGGQVLDHPSRRAIYEAVLDTPGISLAEVTRRVGIPRVVALHHIRTLLSHRLIDRREAGRSVLLFPPQGLASADVMQLTVLQNPARRAIALYLVTQGQGTQAEIADAVGLSARLVSYHLASLRRAGLVHAPTRKVPRVWAPVEDLSELVFALSPSAAEGKTRASS